MITALHGQTTFHSNLMSDIRIAKEAGFEALEVDLQAAVGRAEFGEVLVRAGHAAAQVGVLLDQHHLAARFGRFDGRGDATHPAADHEHLSRSAVSAHRASS